MKIIRFRLLIMIVLLIELSRSSENNIKPNPDLRYLAHTPDRTSTVISRADYLNKLQGG